MSGTTIEALAARIEALEGRIALIEGFIQGSLLAPGAGLDERIVAIETALARVQAAFSAAKGVVG